MRDGDRLASGPAVATSLVEALPEPNRVGSRFHHADGQPWHLFVPEEDVAMEMRASVGSRGPLVGDQAREVAGGGAIVSLLSRGLVFGPDDACRGEAVLVVLAVAVVMAAPLCTDPVVAIATVVPGAAVVAAAAASLSLIPVAGSVAAASTATTSAAAAAAPAIPATLPPLVPSLVLLLLPVAAALAAAGVKILLFTLTTGPQSS